MEFTATGPDGVTLAVAYGAYLHGGRLRCGELFVRAGTREETVTMRDVMAQHEIRVQLPAEVIGKPGHARVKRIELEIT